MRIYVWPFKSDSNYTQSYPCFYAAVPCKIPKILYSKIGIQNIYHYGKYGIL